ncbi:MAG: methionine biosynthesis protein MetW [Proteobacteria bacterium]|nr:methionine biosynthesis protein MetW [Pseudomonadota bacterium]
MRPDIAIIADLVTPGARVLDLGCGDGELLAYLKRAKGVNGYGLEIDPAMITCCITVGVNVIEQDLDQGLTNFPSDSFDLVVMTDTLQSVKRPDIMLDEMLRIGRECIVTFPNFAHWRCRLQLAARGKMPVAKHLPHRWYNTPNIHLCTFADFEALCAAKNLNVIERFVVNSEYTNHPLVSRFPNLLGTTAFYQLGRPQ